jgi:alkylation response protein AidB-like acyl-CoA dehydrogenase
VDFSFSEDQKDLRDLARKILEERSTHERLKAIEAGQDRFDRALWDELAKASLLGIVVPEAFGGSGLGFFELCILLEEIGRTVAKVPVLATAVGALALAESGSEEQQRRWLPAVTSGEAVLAPALSEPDFADPAAPLTVARADRGGFRLDGVKCFVPAAHLAKLLLVPARLDASRTGIFLLDPAASGVRLERQETTNRDLECRITLSGVRVPQSDLLGDPARGGDVQRSMVERMVVGLCAIQLGVTERALRSTAAYMSERRQFDRPIGSFQAAHTRAADAFIDVETIRLTTWEAASRIAAGRPDPEATAIAKFFASEAAYRVVYAALHLHGGIGSDVDYPVHRYYLWAKQIELGFGAAEEQLRKLGAALAA